MMNTAQLPRPIPSGSRMTPRTQWTDAEALTLANYSDMGLEALSYGLHKPPSEIAAKAYEMGIHITEPNY